jgi:hypothetical protein
MTIHFALSLGKKYRTRLLIRAGGRDACWTAWRDVSG